VKVEMVKVMMDDGNAEGVDGGSDNR